VHRPDQEAKTAVGKAVRSAGRKYGVADNADGNGKLVIILLS
jgi:hypothetical protein